MQIANRGKYIDCVVRISAFRARRAIGILLVSAKLNREHGESLCGENLRLWRPAFFAESPAMCQHNSARTRAVEVGLNLRMPIGQRDRNGLLRAGVACEERDSHCDERSCKHNLLLNNRNRS